MWRWLTAMAALITAYLAAGGPRDRRAIFRGGIPAAVCTAVCAGLEPYAPELAFPVSVTAGQAAFLVLTALRREGAIPALAVCLGLDGALAVLCAAEGLDWRYAAGLTAGALCAAAYVRPGTPDTQMPAGGYLAVSAPPAMTLPIDGLILAALLTGGRVSGTAALLLCAAQLLVLALAMALRGRMLRAAATEELTEAMGRWQRDSRDYMNVIRSQRHDLNLHLNAISGLVSGGRFEACREYVSRLVAEAGDVNDIMPLADAVVGSMLYNMREEARRRGSDITYRITYDMADVLCNGFELNKIIGNLLQNAMDAMSSPEDRAAGIRLCVFKRRGNTVITCENRFTGDRAVIARAFEPGFSTKRRHEGIGLAMVKRAAERCGGRVYVEFEEELIRFVVNIPNKVNLSTGRDG